MPGSRPITVRPLHTRDDYAACVALQRETWGDQFSDVVPATILMVSQRVGGVAAGAFDDTGRLLGFVFGISGVRDGALAHWSNMLAVRRTAQGKGVGKQLKLFQRDRLLEHGIKVAAWSYDPLVARNANFNVNILCARPTDYVVDMYGDTGSPLHRGLDTDRLVVDWRLADASLGQHLATGIQPLPRDMFDAPFANRNGPTQSDDPGATLPKARAVRIAIPSDIHRVRALAPAEARLWQQGVRRAFTWYLRHGYDVVGFHPGGDEDRPWYGLSERSVTRGNQ